MRWHCACGYSCKTVERLGIHAAHCRRRFLGLGTIRKWWREAVGVKRGKRCVQRELFT